MNPLKSSSSQQYNRIDNSHSNFMIPVKRLPTAGDGNCLIHALFGEFSYVRHFLLDEVQQEFFHKNAPAVRFEIAHKLFNQGEGNHAIYEELYSIDELGSATSSQININNLALSLQKNGEYLGLEHAHLIAKAFKLNIRVYYPKSHAYEKIDLFHRDTNTQDVDRIVYFNGINHWEKCELSNEPGLPSSLDFISQYSLDESTTASSRRSSFDLRPKPQVNPKYKQIFSYQKTLASRGYNPRQRLEANTHFIQTLQGQINKKINGSYLFTPGKQVKDQRFQDVFIDFFREMRGVDTLVNSTGESLANKFKTSPDMCKIYETQTVDEYGIDTSTEISPTIQLIDELKQILEDEYGLQDQFITALDKNGKRFNDFAKLEDRDLFLATLPKDHEYRQKWGLQTAPIYIPLSMIAKLFPKCVESLKEIFNSLLTSEWLKKDIDGIKLYLNENDYVDRPLPSLEEIIPAIRLWEKAKEYGEQQRKYDTDIEAKHWNEFQNDLWGTVVSGGLSICTVNPTFVIGKAAHTMMNVLSNQVDPEGRDKRVQVLKMFGGVGLGGVMGGNPWDIGTSLGIDLVELAVRDKKTTKGESALLTLWGSVLKGVLTGDQKKLVCQILGGCVAEAAGQLPETDENTSLERRIARALLTNSDVQAHFIKGFVDKRFKDDPKPKTGSELTPEEQEKYPKQIITEVEPEQIIKEPEQPVKVEMQNEPLYLRLIEEQKQNQADLKLAQADCETKRQAAEKASKKEQNLHKKNTGFKLIPKPKVYQEWLDSKKTLSTKNGEYQTSQGRVGEIQEKMYKNSKAQLVASSPKTPITQTDKGLSSSITNLNRIDREIPEKILAVEKSIDNYNEHHRKDSYFSEVKRTIKDLNSSFKERDTEQNNISRFNGVESNIETPLIEIPKKASALAKIILWCKDNVVLGIHPPTQPFNYDPNKPIPPQSNKGSTYHETRHQINLERSELNVLEEKSKPVSQGSNWNSVSHYHSQRMFETNMAFNYMPPSDQTLCNTLHRVNNREMQVAGVPGKTSVVASNLLKGLINMFVPDMSDMPGAENPRDHINRIVTPEATGDFIKSLPKGPAFLAKGIISLMMPDMSDVKGTEDPKTHFNRVFQSSMKKYDEIVQIHNPNGLAARSGMFVGEMVALGGVGKVIRVAKGLSVFGMACEGGFIGGVMSEAHETNVVAGVAFGFIGGAGFSKLLLKGGGVSKPLLDRTLVRPQGFGRQLRNAEIQQVLRCGFVSDKTVMRLTEREIKAITPFKLPSVQSGSELTWLSENAPKITQLRQLKGVDKFDQFLKATFRGQELSENQIRRLLNYSDFNTYHKPIGLPSEVMVEFSKKNGGMIYRKIGSTNPENLVVRVCPGLAEESIVSSVLKGKHLNGELPGTLRQQYPYVVQRKGREYLTRYGTWIKEDNPAITHIPLEIYEFRGWN